MIRDHSRIEELLAVRALGGLDGDDVDVLERELAAHGDCAECRALEAGLGEAAGRLAFALDPEPVSASMADRIVATPTSVPRATTDPSAAAPFVADEVAVVRERRRGRGWRTLAAVAAGVVLILAGALVLGPRSVGIEGVTATQTFVRFEGDGSLAMAFVPGRRGAALIGTDLPDPGPGNLYEVWLIRGQTPVSGGCVSPIDGTLAAFIDADVSRAEAMAVTIEPESCPPAPTSDPFSTAPLPSA